MRTLGHIHARHEANEKAAAEAKICGWIYTHPERTDIPPVLSLRKLDNKHDWIERPLFAGDATRKA